MLRHAAEAGAQHRAPPWFVRPVAGRGVESAAGAQHYGGVASFYVRGGAQAAVDAREELVSRDGVLPASVHGDVLLLLTELVTNAVRHGGAHVGRSVGVRVARSAGRVNVAVSDSGPGFEWRGRDASHPPAGGGYGLLLVDRMASRWGIERRERSTTVWFEFLWDTPAGTSAR